MTKLWLRNACMFGFIAAVGLMVLLAPADAAAAPVTYQYTGNHFSLFCGPSSSCSSNPSGTSYTTIDRVSATLSLSQPLPANLNLQDISTLPGFTLTMSDGHQTLTWTAGQIGPFEARISTDATGQITGPWSLIINCCFFPNNGIAALNWPGGRGVADSGVLSAPSPNNGYPNTPLDEGLVIGSPGTWGPATATLDTTMPYGTATRNIANTRPFGVLPEDNYDFIGGGFNAPRTFEFGAVIPVGMTEGYGEITGPLPGIPQGLRAGAYSEMGIDGAGAGRGVAFATYTNFSLQTLTFYVNAVLSGEVNATHLCGLLCFGQAHATAGVYAFDPSVFKNTIAANGGDAANFLLGGTSLVAGTGGTRTSLATLFPSNLGAVNTPDENVLPGVQSYALKLGPLTLAPQQSVTLMFDATAASGGGGIADFISTLAPASNFFTDGNGNPVTGVLAVSPSAAPTSTPATLALTPAAATNPVGTAQTITATATTSAGAPVSGVNVRFLVVSGPSAGLKGVGVTDATGRTTFKYANTSGVAGDDSIQASIGTLQSNVVKNTWTVPGPLDHITVSPASATIAAGGTQAYSAQAFDPFNTSLGDVTASTTFSIAPDGSCTGANCTASVAGPHTVTGSYANKAATVSLTVTAPTGYAFRGFFAPIDMSTPSQTVWNTANAGQAIPVKWQLTLNGQPVSDPTSFAGLSSYPVSCTSGVGSIEDAIEEVAPGDSALVYSGNGNWHYNWKTPKSYKNTCRVMIVNFGDGTTSPGANFKFK